MAVACAVTVGEFAAAESPIRRIERFGQPEVQDLHRPVVANFDVRRLQIAMDDAVVVGLLERLGNLPRDWKRLFEWYGAPRHPGGEILAVHEFHHDRMDPVCFFETVDLGNVRVIQPRERPRFPLKTPQSLGVSREHLRQDLQRDVTIQLRIARSIDLAHATGAKSIEDFVRAEAGAARETHEVSDTQSILILGPACAHGRIGMPKVSEYSQRRIDALPKPIQGLGWTRQPERRQPDRAG